MSSSFPDFECILYAMLGKCIDLNQKKEILFCGLEMIEKLP